MPRGSPRGAVGPLSTFALAVGVFVFSHDFVGVGVALPSVQEEFSSSLGTVQWTITGFSIAIALAVVPAGRLIDVHGAGKIFVGGSFALGLASGLIAVAPEMWIFLAGRAIAGVAVGFLWISAIALTFARFGLDRVGLAGAFLIGIGGLGTALGPIDTGLLIEWLGWRAAFLFNVPLCLFAGAVMLRHPVPAPVAGGRSVDWAGIGVLGASLVALLVTLRYAPEWGWGAAPTIAGLLAVAALLVTFALQQRARGSRALIPPDVAANRVFAITLAGEALLGGSFYAALSFGPQVFTNVLGANPIETGLMQAPTMLAFALFGAVTGILLGRVPPTTAIPAAGAVAALGGLLLALMPDQPTYLALLPGLVLVGAGTGAVFSALVTVGVGSLPEGRRGLAGGLLYIMQLTGGAAVLAAATAIATDADGGPGSLVHGIQRGFLFSVVVGALGVAVTALGYRAARSRRPPT